MLLKTFYIKQNNNKKKEFPGTQVFYDFAFSLTQQINDALTSKTYLCHVHTLQSY